MDASIVQRPDGIAALTAELPDDIVEVLPHTMHFEGFTTWFYLDVKGIVTVGVGCALLSEAEATALPMFAPDGSSASVDQIARDYLRVRAMRAGLVARAYLSPLSVHCSEETVKTLLSKKYIGFRRDLQNIFPAFDTYPLPARMVLLDMVFNLGPGRPATNLVRATGFHEFRSLIGCVEARDWFGAAKNCARESGNKAFDGRNQWAAQQFQTAAKG